MCDRNINRMGVIKSFFYVTQKNGGGKCKKIIDRKNTGSFSTTKEQFDLKTISLY